MHKGAIAKAISEEHGIATDVAGKIIVSFANFAQTEVAANGIFIFPGVCKINKISVSPKPERQQKIFGKIQTVKARPARHMVKVRPLSALKKVSTAI